MTNTGFEYQNKKDETPFETFLRYTDEKEKSAVKLAAVLSGKLGAGSKVLDIGTGNGEYLTLALSKIDVPGDLSLTLVEPSADLVSQLEERFEKQFPAITPKVVISDLQGFSADEKFDVILMSHLFYHLPRASWQEQLAKALSLLNPDGVLIVVLREKDDVYDFKMAFKPLLFKPDFKALVIDDILEVLPDTPQTNYARETAPSELTIPYETNKDDTISIIEFFLNKQWDEIPAEIQQAAMDFIKEKNGVFQQMDAIAVITKINENK